HRSAPSEAVVRMKDSIPVQFARATGHRICASRGESDLSRPSTGSALDLSASQTRNLGFHLPRFWRADVGALGTDSTALVQLPRLDTEWGAVFRGRRR